MSASITRIWIGCQWIIGTPIDHLGMLVSMDSKRTFLKMTLYVYINNALEIMEWSHLKPAARPLRDSINIDGESPKLDVESARRWHTVHTGLGMLG